MKRLPAIAVALLLVVFMLAWISRGACTSVPMSTVGQNSNTLHESEVFHDEPLQLLHAEAVVASKMAFKAIGTDDFPAAIKVFNAKVEQIGQIDTTNFGHNASDRQNALTCKGWFKTGSLLVELMTTAHRQGQKTPDMLKCSVCGEKFRPTERCQKFCPPQNYSRCEANIGMIQEWINIFDHARFSKGE